MDETGKQQRLHNKTEVIDLAEASKKMHCSYSTTLRLAKNGDLEAFRIRGAWRTTVAACDKYIERAFAEQRLVVQSLVVDD